MPTMPARRDSGMRDPEVTVLFVKKILANGDIEQRLNTDGLTQHVDDVVLAREGDPTSAGMQLAARHDVQHAPFFVLRQVSGEEQVIDSYLAFKRWFSNRGSTIDDLADAVDKHPDLAFI